MSSADDTHETTEKTTALDLIEEQAEASIRRDWHDGRWFFSIVDVIGLLTDSPTPRRYWAELKRKLRDEGFAEVFARSEQLRMTAADGKQRLTDAADAETLLRLRGALSGSIALANAPDRARAPDAAVCRRGRTCAR
jgi:hypothetical protein